MGVKQNLCRTAVSGLALAALACNTQQECYIPNAIPCRSCNVLADNSWANDGVDGKKPRENILFITKTPEGIEHEYGFTDNSFNPLKNPPHGEYALHILNRNADVIYTNTFNLPENETTKIYFPANLDREHQIAELKIYNSDCAELISEDVTLIGFRY